MNKAHLVYCTKFKKELPGLASPPVPGELGQKIQENISMAAWSEWLNHQTMLINEYKLALIDPKARKFLLEEMEKYFFGEGSEKPPQYQE